MGWATGHLVHHLRKVAFPLTTSLPPFAETFTVISQYTSCMENRKVLYGREESIYSLKETYMYEDVRRVGGTERGREGWSDRGRERREGRREGREGFEGRREEGRGQGIEGFEGERGKESEGGRERRKVAPCKPRDKVSYYPNCESRLCCIA